MKNKKRVKKPNFFLYTVPSYIMKVFARFYWHLKVDNKEIRKVKSPILAIAPHTSTMDILPTVVTLLPKRYNVVTGRDLFTWKQLRPFIKAFGAIPKDQCAIDLKCMRTLHIASEEGNNILLYPEGRTSLDGKEMFYLPPAIGKFIKYIDSNVVVVQSHGVYLTKPRFIHGFRRGRIETKASLLFTREEVRTKSVQEITEKVREAMKFNDNIWQQQNKVAFSAKDLANNLNYILYKCPKCGQEYEMDAKDGFLTCRACGNKVEYTKYGELLAQGNSKTFERIDLWTDYEREELRKEIEKEDFFIEKAVTAFVRNDETNSYDEVGKGTLKIDRDAITYQGTVQSEESMLRYDLREVPTIVTKNTEGIDLIIAGKTYRFLFDEHKWSHKYGLCVEQIFCMKHNL